MGHDKYRAGKFETEKWSTKRRNEKCGTGIQGK